jgi:hypothetical protein
MGAAAALAFGARPSAPGEAWPSTLLPRGRSRRAANGAERKCARDRGQRGVAVREASAREAIQDFRPRPAEPGESFRKSAPKRCDSRPKFVAGALLVSRQRHWMSSNGSPIRLGKADLRVSLNCLQTKRPLMERYSRITTVASKEARERDAKKVHAKRPVAAGPRMLRPRRPLRPALPL